MGGGGGAFAEHEGLLDLCPDSLESSAEEKRSFKVKTDALTHRAVGHKRGCLCS